MKINKIIFWCWNCDKRYEVVDVNGTNGLKSCHICKGQLLKEVKNET